MTSESDLEQSAGILALRRDGFLSEAIDFMLPTLRAMHAPWFDFAERTNQLGQRIMNSAEAACAGRTTHDPVSLATRLLIRSMSSFQAAVILTERGMAIDALTLVRGLYENALWLGFLMRAPAEAVHALAVDEWRSQRGRDKALLSQLTRAGSPDLVMKGRLEARVADADLALKGQPRLSVEELADKGDFGDFYIYFKMLSSGSAHPSFHSLSKHLNMNPDGTWSGHVTGPDSEGMAQALTLGSHAVLVNLAAFNGVWPAADGAAEVQDRLGEHLVLSGVNPLADREEG